jgi:hypothetical protein
MTYEIPPEYISGRRHIRHTVHPKDPDTRHTTGQIITILANVRVHECRRDVGANEPSL